MRKSSPALPLLRGLLMAAAVATASGAWAQWQWKDANGRRIFSDTPPPASVPDRDILQRPRGMAQPSAASPDNGTASPAAPGAAAGDAPRPDAAPKPAPSAGDAALEQRKRQLEQAEADKRKAEEKAAQEKAAKTRAANCEAARRNKTTLESGVRMTVTNAKGEAEFLDEAGRAAQLRQANEQIRENCR